MQLPHLGLKFEVCAEHTREEWFDKCKGNVERKNALQEKLTDVSVFEPV